MLAHPGSDAAGHGVRPHRYASKDVTSGVARSGFGTIATKQAMAINAYSIRIMVLIGIDANDFDCVRWSKNRAPANVSIQSEQLIVVIYVKRHLFTRPFHLYVHRQVSPRVLKPRLQVYVHLLVGQVVVQHERPIHGNAGRRQALSMCGEMPTFLSRT